MIKRYIYYFNIIIHKSLKIQFTFFFKFIQKRIDFDDMNRSPLIIIALNLCVPKFVSIDFATCN